MGLNHGPEGTDYKVHPGGVHLPETADVAVIADRIFIGNAKATVQALVAAASA
ncbi:MAG: hypothetical protein R2810_08815 [Flavobacteriales bacterium]